MYFPSVPPSWIVSASATGSAGPEARGERLDDPGLGWRPEEAGDGFRVDDAGDGFRVEDAGDGLRLDEAGDGFRLDDPGVGFFVEDAGEGLRLDDPGAGSFVGGGAVSTEAGASPPCSAMRPVSWASVRYPFLTRIPPSGVARASPSDRLRARSTRASRS
jgi:hypothetical protein